MVTEFRYLFTPIDIGPMTLRNRIVNSPHNTGFAKDNQYDEREVYYLKERAKGGAAMLCTGTTMVDPRLVPMLVSKSPADIDDSVIPWYRRISDAVHEYGAKFVVQLSDMGGVYSPRLYPDAFPSLAASPIPNTTYKEVRL